MNLNETIIKIRVELQNSKIKKSGKNRFAGFEYYELADFLPKLNELMLKEKVNDRFTIKDGLAMLELIKGEERQEYTIPFKIFETPLAFKKNKDGSFMKDSIGNYIQVPSMQDIQYLGALNTYYKRYLYLNAFGITDGEVIDSMDSANLQKGVTFKPNTKDQEKEILTLMSKMKELVIDTNSDFEEIYKYYKVEDSSSMTLNQLEDCVKNLEQKKKKIEMLRESGQVVE